MASYRRFFLMRHWSQALSTSLCARHRRFRQAPRCAPIYSLHFCALRAQKDERNSHEIAPPQDRSKRVFPSIKENFHFFVKKGCVFFFFFYDAVDL